MNRNKGLYKRVSVLLAAAVCFAMFASCNQSAVLQNSSEILPVSSSQPAESGLPDYLNKLTGIDMGTAAAEARITREDLGITVTLMPYQLSGYVQAILDMDLQPLGSGAVPLSVPKPFTLHLIFGEREDTFAFTADKITVNGADYMPMNSAPLEALYAEDSEKGLLTEELYYLRDEMGFTAQEVITLELTQTFQTETKLTITNKETIAALVDALGGFVVRKPRAQEDIFPDMGGLYTLTATLADNTTWTYIGNQSQTQKSGDEAINHVVLADDFEAVFGLINDFPKLPRLKAAIGDIQPQIYQIAFDYENNQKTTEQPTPEDMLFATDPVITPGQDAACVLSFPDSDGQHATPQKITATVYRETDQNRTLDTSTPLTVSNNSVSLPNTEGKYYLTVLAEYPQGWVKSMLEYRVTSLPWYFDDIEYGNSEDNVSITRDDAQISILGGQNRKYVEFIQSLQLAPAQGTAIQELPVLKPFTLSFGYDIQTDVFQFTPQGITYNGAAFVTPEPQAVARLYETITAENIHSEIINHRLRGFLSKEVSRLTDLFPIHAADIKKLVVADERPEEYTSYDVTGELAFITPECFSNIVLAKDLRQEDYYFPRRFFTSFTITMKDGTVYEVGEKLLVNGKDSGWYTVCSESTAAKALMDSTKGETAAREQRLPGGYSIDEDGNITFS